MWLPIERSERNDLTLFRPRFDAECAFPTERQRKSAWYLYGAQATIKALSVGTMLFSLIRNMKLKIRLTTKPDFDSIEPGTIVLFEAFAVGSFKVPHPSGVPRNGDEWDAFTASLAWGALHKSFRVPSGPQLPRRLHTVGTQSPEKTLSIWSIIAGNVPSITPVDGPPDCDVVGFASESLMSGLAARNSY